VHSASQLRDQKLAALPTGDSTPHLHPGQPPERAEGVPTTWHRSILLVLAIMIHNIPEGLAIGVAFGALAHGSSTMTLGGAIALAVGIGLQNLPEGTAVSVPLRREGFSRPKSFWFGQLSGMVEPVAGALGAVAVVLLRPLLPTRSRSPPAPCSTSSSRS